MNNKLTALVLVCLCLATTVVCADQDYRSKNIFNRMTDWSSTLFKPSEEKREIMDQRVQMRADKRQENEVYKEKKQALTEKYHQQLLSISHEDIGAQEMAIKLKTANNDYKLNMDNLKKGGRHE